jgi:hypothetical protein
MNCPGYFDIVALSNLPGQTLHDCLADIVDGLLSLRHTHPFLLGMARFNPSP